MFSSKIKILALSVLVLGAATNAFACGDKDKASNSSTQASYSSNAKGASGCPAMAGMTKEECAAKMAAGECTAHGAKMASAESGCCAKDKNASMADCTYGKSTVMLSGTCPAANEANYSFAIADAECKETGTAVAKAIKSVKGVASVTVNYDKHMAYVCADKKVTNQNAIAASLKKAGYSDVKFVSEGKENCAKAHAKVEA